jgi:hypothetical protein
MRFALPTMKTADYAETQNRAALRSNRLGALAAVAAALLCGAGGARAQSPRFAFARTASENTSVPGGSGFLDLFTPSQQAGHVAFLGLQDNVEGVYTISPNGDLTIVADSTTLVPGDTVPFERFGPFLTVDRNRVVFNALAFPASGPDAIEGYYAFENGLVTPIADLTTPIPSGAGNFEFLWNPNDIASADAGRVVFVGGGANDLAGIYSARGGSLSRLVDTSTPVPGDTRAFRNFRSPVLHGDRLAFVADLDDSTQGLYLHHLTTGTLSVVADSNTPFPGGGDSFASFGSGLNVGGMLDLDGDTLVFLGDIEFRQHGAAGIYRYDISTGTLTAVAEDGTPVPGQPDDQFGPYFQSVSVNNGHVAFQYGAFVVSRFDEFITPFYGIYSDVGGPLEKVIALGDVLDGLMIDMPGPRSSGVLEIGAEALDGNQIAMLVQLEDGARAIYVATLVPEPATMALILSAGLMALGLAGWRRQAGKLHHGRNIRPQGTTKRQTKTPKRSMRPTSVLAMALTFTVAAVGSLPNAATAQSRQFAFAKVADFDTSLPGAAGKFAGSDEEPPALEAGRVAFWAYGDEVDGVYTGAPGGSLTLVADTTTLMPFAPVPFDGHDYVSLDGGRVVFLGWGQDAEDNYYEGIYRFENGMLDRIADLDSAVPSKETNFLELYGPSPSRSGPVAFIGIDFDDLEDGVYTGSGGPLARVADTSTRVPGRAENFEYFYEVRADREKVVFVADSSSDSGVYLHDTVTGALSRVADTSTPVPGLTEDFTGFADGLHGLDLDGATVAFIGSFDSSRVGAGGVYVADVASGLITPIADTDARIPNGEGEFRDAFTAVAVDDGHIAFGYGLDGNPRTRPPTPQTPFFGVYTNLGGLLEPLLRAGDVLDGKVVGRAFVGSEGLDGNQIAISVVFTDDSEAIYVATLIPEPASLALLFTAGCLLTLITWRLHVHTTKRDVTAGDIPCA